MRLWKKEKKELLTKVADYANEEKKIAIKRKSLPAYISIGIVILIIAVFAATLISRNITQQHNEEKIVGAWNCDGQNMCTFNSNGIVSITDSFPINDTGLKEGMAVYYFTYPNVIRMIQQEDDNEASAEFEIVVSDHELILSFMGEKYIELEK